MLDEQVLRSIISIQCKQNDIPADVHQFLDMDSGQLEEILYQPYRYRQVLEANEVPSQVCERNLDPISVDRRYGIAKERSDVVHMEFVFGGQHLLTGNKNGFLVLRDLRHRTYVGRSLSPH